MQISQEKYQCLFSEHNRIVYQYSRPGQGSKDMNLNFKFGRPNSICLLYTSDAADNRKLEASI